MILQAKQKDIINYAKHIINTAKGINDIQGKPDLRETELQQWQAIKGLATAIENSAYIAIKQLKD